MSAWDDYVEARLQMGGCLLNIVIVLAVIGFIIFLAVQIWNLIVDFWRLWLILLGIVAVFVIAYLCKKSTDKKPEDETPPAAEAKAPAVTEAEVKEADVKKAVEAAIEKEVEAEAVKKAAKAVAKKPVKEPQVVEKKSGGSGSLEDEINKYLNN